MATGTIVKPGGSEAGLHQKVFFLPQKPYNVLGTLQEQLTYPQKLDKDLSREELAEILDEVDAFAEGVAVVSYISTTTLCTGWIGLFSRSSRHPESRS